jgi:hypothetical protein
LISQKGEKDGKEKKESCEEESSQEKSQEEEEKEVTWRLKRRPVGEGPDRSRHVSRRGKIRSCSGPEARWKVPLDWDLPFFLAASACNRPEIIYINIRPFPASGRCYGPFPL